MKIGKLDYEWRLSKYFVPYFKWYDIWVGLFPSIRSKRLYVGIVPFIGFYIQFGGFDGQEA